MWDFGPGRIIVLGIYGRRICWWREFRKPGNKGEIPNAKSQENSKSQILKGWALRSSQVPDRAILDPFRMVMLPRRRDRSARKASQGTSHLTLLRVPAQTWR